MAQPIIPATDKFGNVLKPFFDTSALNTNAQFQEQARLITAQNQELQLLLEKVLARIDVLELTMAGAKKTVSRTPKTAEAGQGIIAAAPAAGNKVPINKLYYFRTQYKTDPTFREQFGTPEVLRALEEDTASKNKTPEQLIVHQATIAWNVLKNNPIKTKEILDLYEAAKKAEAAASNPVLTIETITPPTDTIVKK